MRGAAAHPSPPPAAAGSPQRVVIAADTWLARHGLVGCLPPMGGHVDLAFAESVAQLVHHTRAARAAVLVVAEGALVMRLARSGQWPTARAPASVRWVIACPEDQRAELTACLAQRCGDEITIGHDALTLTARLARLVTPQRHLSARQQEILAMLQRGMSNKQIAGQLGLAVGTVKNHVSALLRHLNVSSRTHAALSRPDATAGCPEAHTRCV